MRQRHLGGAGSDEEHRVAPIALPHDQLVRHDETGPQELGDAVEVVVVEPGEQVEAGHQRARVEPDVEAGQGLGVARVLDAHGQVAIDLRGDQALVVERAVPSDLPPQRGLAQEARLERGGIIGVLAAQRVEAGLDAVETVA